MSTCQKRCPDGFKSDSIPVILDVFLLIILLSTFSFPPPDQCVFFFFFGRGKGMYGVDTYLKLSLFSLSRSILNLVSGSYRGLY